MPMNCHWKVNIQPRGGQHSTLSLGPTLSHPSAHRRTLPLDLLLWHEMCQSSVRKAVASFPIRAANAQTLQMARRRHRTPLGVRGAPTQVSPVLQLYSTRSFPQTSTTSWTARKQEQLALLSCSCVTQTDVELLSFEDQVTGGNF